MTKTYQEIKLVTQEDIDMYLSGVGKDVFKNHPTEFTVRLIATVQHQEKEIEDLVYRLGDSSYPSEYDDYEGHLHEE